MTTEDFIQEIRPLRNRLYRLALLLGSRPQEAEDVVQETLVRYWKHRDQIRNPQAWCYQLVRRLRVDDWREKRKWTSPAPTEAAQPGPDPFERTAQLDIRDRIWNLVDKLPEKQKLTFQLREMEGMSYREIADALEIPLNQVKVNLHRARTRLKDQLQKIYFYERS